MVSQGSLEVSDVTWKERPCLGMKPAGSSPSWRTKASAGQAQILLASCPSLQGWAQRGSFSTSSPASVPSCQAGRSRQLDLHMQVQTELLVGPPPEP